MNDAFITCVKGRINWGISLLSGTNPTCVATDRPRNYF